MLNMLYINDISKKLIHFSIEGMSLDELYSEYGDKRRVLEEACLFYETRVGQFGGRVDVPTAIVQGHNEEELEYLLYKLHGDPVSLFKNNFFAIFSPEMMRYYLDKQTSRKYLMLGFNRAAVLIKCEDVSNFHYASVEFDEFNERFSLI